jgi:hypothetical protein
MYNKFKYKNDTRFIPLAGPFLLGALTGGVATYAFSPRPRPVMYYPNYPMYY